MPGPERTAKHRSSQACQACRVRKVRCDVRVSGTPCTNCRLDDTECVLLASRRGKHNRAHDSVNGNFAAHLQSSEPPSGPNLRETDDRADHRDERTPTPTMPSSAGDVPVCVTFDEDHPIDDHGHMGNDRIDDEARGLPTPDRWSLEQRDVPTSTRSSNGPGTLDYNPCPIGQAPLPAFIAPLPAHMLNEDMAFLVQKGAFAMPDPELRAEILRSYTFSVSPFMPILDLPAFVDAVLNEREGGRISLLLFQAVMFAGLASLDLRSVHCLGFESTKQAREVFFSRVRLLYEFDVEPDSAAMFQSLLLMSLWYGRWNERRHTWYWTGLALSMAQNMGLHREPTPSCGSDKTRRLRKRLWWSLYIRDRLLALGTRRPMRIRDDGFDVAMLTLEDFDVEPLAVYDHAQPPSPDVEENTRTALMCIELAKLSICIGHVLSSQYTTLSTQPDVRHTMMVVPRCDGERTVSELERCDGEINDWLQALGTNIRRLSSRTAQAKAHSCSEVHWSMLNMAHLTLLNVLHRTQALQPLSGNAEAQAIQTASRLKVKDAARNVTKLAHTMLRHDEVRFLGPLGVTALVAACLSHMLDIRSGDEDVRDASILRFYQSMQVLQSLRVIYASADSAVSFIAAAIRKAGIPVPSQVVTPALEFVSERLGGSTATGLGNSAASRSGRRWTEPSTAGSPWQANYFHLNPQQPAISYPPTTQSTLFRSEPETQDTSSVVDAGVSSTATDVPLSLQDVSCFISKLAANEPFFEWNGSMDSGMSLEPVAFDYDFGSDAFGFLDGQLQGP